MANSIYCYHAGKYKTSSSTDWQVGDGSVLIVIDTKEDYENTVKLEKEICETTGRTSWHKPVEFTEFPDGYNIKIVKIGRRAIQARLVRASVNR